MNTTSWWKGRVRPAAFAVLAVLTWAAAGAGAQPFDTPPPPGAPRPLAIAAPSEQSLPNGLRVVLAERRGLPLVTARLLILSGSEADPPARAGLASLTAGLLTKGTARRSAPALAQAAEALGGSLDSGAGWNQSSVAITVTTPKLSDALALVAEVAMRPTFAQAELDRLRAQVLDELKVAYSQPGTIARLASEHLLFGAGAYGHPPGGTPASLARITRADLLALHKSVFRPDNAVLVLAGDLGPADALALAQRHFGRWKAPAAPLATPALAAWTPAAALATGVAAIDMGASGQAGVALALPVPTDADAAAGQVTNAVLGGDYSSRLNQEIRIKRGLSYGAKSQIDVRRGASVLRAAVQTKNESAAEVVGLLQGEIDALIGTPVPEAELAARKATLIGSFSRSVETTAGLGEVLSSLLATGRAPGELRTRIAALQAVGAAEVQAYAAANFGAARRRLVVAGEAKQFDAALKALVPDLVIVPHDALDLERADGLRTP